MAMPSGNVVVSDKMQFPNGGGEILGNHHQRQWFPDERDGFISWLRGEFAAANAIIDSLCHHLRLIGEAGEYDGVIGSIQQRRCNWNPVLHMQQYFSVAEVGYALQQVSWRRQQHQHQHHCDPVKVSGRRSSFGSRQGQRVESVKESYSSNFEYQTHDVNSMGNSAASHKGSRVAVKAEAPKLAGEVVKSQEDTKREGDPKPKVDDTTKDSSNLHSAISGNPELNGEGLDDSGATNSEGQGNVLLDDSSNFVQDSNEQPNLTIVPKTFVATEMIDGKAVNVVDGLKMYGEVLDASAVSKLVALVNDLRSAGRKGQFQGGQTYVISKRPMKGHGREMIQLGIPIADVPPPDNENAPSKEGRIPGLLQDVIERITSMEIMNAKPDSCIIDIFNEGDHSQPHMWPSWFGRPVCVLFLTECDMTFGKVIGIDHHPGDYRGSFNLSLAPGSLLVMEGRCADFTKHALPSIRKQRIIVTLTKSQAKKISAAPPLPSDGRRYSSPAAAVPPPSSSHWVPPPASIRSPNNHILRHHSVVPKQQQQQHYGPVPTTTTTTTTTGVLPLPLPLGAPNPNPNGIQHGGGGWPVVASPMAMILRSPVVPGTGVFLPPPVVGGGDIQHSSTGIINNNGIMGMEKQQPPPSNGNGNHNNSNSNSNSSASPTSKNQTVDGIGSGGGGKQRQKLECCNNGDNSSSMGDNDDDDAKGGATIEMMKVVTKPAAA